MNIEQITEIALLLDDAGFVIGTTAHRTTRDMLIQEAEAVRLMGAGVGPVASEAMLVAMAARNVSGNRTAHTRLVQDGCDPTEARDLLQELEERAEDALASLRPES